MTTGRINQVASLLQTVAGERSDSSTTSVGVSPVGYQRRALLAFRETKSGSAGERLPDLHRPFGLLNARPRGPMRDADPCGVKAFFRPSKCFDRSPAAKKCSRPPTVPGSPASELNVGRPRPRRHRFAFFLRETSRKTSLLL